MRRRRIIIASLAFAGLLIAGVVVGGYVLRAYLADKDRLVSILERQVRSGEFTAMYNESSDFMKLNNETAEFSFRMNTIRDYLKQYDSEVTFHRDRETEERIDRIIDESGRRVAEDLKEKGINRETQDPNTISVILNVEGSKDLKIFVTWSQTGISPKLFNLTVRNHKTSQDLNLAGDPFMTGEQH